ncbi:MAG: caspase family protein [Thermodesulfobacteriota bacterium]
MKQRRGHQKNWVMTLVTAACVLMAFSGTVPAGEKDPEIFVQLGHSGVQSVVFSADGKYALSGGDKTVKIWDVGSGREIRTYTGEHTGFVASAVFSPDERYLLSCGTEGKIVLWDAHSGEKVREFGSPGKTVFRAVFSPDGRTIASGGMDAVIKLWDVATGEQTRTLSGHAATVRTLTYGPGGRYLLSGSWDKTIKLWDVAAGREVRTFVGHTAAVNAVAFSPDGRYVLSAGGKDGTVRYWEAVSGRELANLRGHTGEVTSVAFSADGRMAVSGSFDRTVRIWDLARAGELKSLPAGEVSVFSVAISPDGGQLLAGSRNMSLWDLAAGKKLRTLEGKVNWVNRVALAPDGKYALSGNFDGTINLWDSITAQRLWTFTGTKGIVSSLAFAPDNRSILDCRSDGPLTLREVETGRELLRIDGQGAAAFSRDGKWIVSGDAANRIRLWDAASGRDVKSFAGHTDKILCVAFSSDGRTIASAGRDKTVRLWDIESGREMRAFKNFRYHVNAVAFSPDDKRVFAGSSDNTAKLFEVQSGRQLQEWKDFAISSVAFSPDGRYALTSGFDGTPKLLAVATGERVMNFKGHKLNAYSAVFSPDGKRIITGSGDGTMRIWDVKSGLETGQFIGFIDGEWIVITPEGYYNSSRQGHENLNIRLGSSVYGIDQFYDVFYRPDIVAAKLKGDDISGLITLTIDDALRNPPPTVAFTSVPTATDQSAVKVCYQVKSAGGGIGEVRLFHNGKLIESDGFYRDIAKASAAKTELAALNSRGIYEDMRAVTVKGTGDGTPIVSKSKGEVFEDCKEVESVSGENEVSVTAFNNTNTVQSYMKTAGFSASIKGEEPHLYILSIGIDKYKEGSVNLKYPVKDATDMARKLVQQSATLFNPKNIHPEMLTDKEAAKAKILNKIDAISQKIKPGDSFILFGAGHGILLQNQYYMLTSEFDGSVSEETMISSNEIVEMSKRIKSLSQLFIFDTCHAGGVDTIVSGLYDARMSVLAKKMGLHIYASASSKEAAMDGYQGNGLFTFTLMDGLSNKTEADRNTDGRVSLEELGEYSKQSTAAISKRIGHQQTPLIINFGRDNPVYSLKP